MEMQRPRATKPSLKQKIQRNSVLGKNSGKLHLLYMYFI